MIICPNFNNPDVAREFEELKNATSEKAAYAIWSLNNGNAIDKAPNGAESKLFKDLLNIFNDDRKAAIRAKSKVYSNGFINWFGDWVNDSENASKVVDDNGEPLIVYHHTNNPNLNTFSIEFDNYFSKDGGTKEAIFFDENITGTLNRKFDLPVFLNIRDLNEYNETKEQLHQRGTTYRQIVNESAKNNNKDGGVHMKDFDDNKMEHQSIWIIHNPNQVKSATYNNGDFSKTFNPDINDPHDIIRNDIIEFCKRLGFEIHVDKTADLMIDFANKIITLQDFDKESFDEIQSIIASVLMPTDLKQQIKEVALKYNKEYTDNDLQKDILDALNNKDNWLQKEPDLLHKILQFISNIFNKIFKNQEYYETLIQKSAKEIADKNSEWYRTVIQEGFQQKELDIDKLKQSSQYNIYKVLTDLGASLDGSAAVRAQGTLYRKGEEDFHDLDFSKPFDDFSWDVKVELDEFFNNYKIATDNFTAKDKIIYKDLRKQMLDNCTEHLKRSKIYKELSKYYSDIYVKHASKSKKLGLLITLSVDGNPVDIFYDKNVKQYTINGIKVTDFSVAFAAKLVMGRDKDIRDIINFHKFNQNNNYDVNNIYYNLKGVDIKTADDAEKLIADIIKHYFHFRNTKYGNTTVSRTQSTIHQERKNLIFTLTSFGLSELSAHIDNTTGRVIFHHKMIQDQLEYIKDAIDHSEETSLEEKQALFSFLQWKFPQIKGIKFKSLSGENAHFEDGWVVINQNASLDILVEECLHPFVAALKSENPELFEELLKEARKDFKKLRADIAYAYRNKSIETRQLEIVTQALSRHFADLWSDKTEQENDGVKKKSIWRRAIEYILDLLGLGEIWYIDKNTTLKELAEAIYKADKIKIEDKYFKNIYFNLNGQQGNQSITQEMYNIGVQIEDERTQYINSVVQQYQQNNPNASQQAISRVYNNARRQFNIDKSNQLLQQNQTTLAQSFGLIQKKLMLEFFINSLQESTFKAYNLENINRTKYQQVGSVQNASSVANAIYNALYDGDLTTLDKELARDYVRMFWGSDLIQAALDSLKTQNETPQQLEDKLVDRMTQQPVNSRNQNIIQWFNNIWAQLSQLVKTVFGQHQFSDQEKNNILKAVDAAFMISQDLEYTNNNNIIYDRADGNYNSSTLLSEKDKQVLSSIKSGIKTRLKSQQSRNVKNQKLIADLKTRLEIIDGKNQDSIYDVFDIIQDFLVTANQEIGKTRYYIDRTLLTQGSMRNWNPQEINFIQQDLIGYYKNLLGTIGDMFADRMSSINKLNESRAANDPNAINLKNLVNQLINNIDGLQADYNSRVVKPYVRMILTDYVNQTDAITNKRTFIYNMERWLDQDTAYGDLAFGEVMIGIASRSKSPIVRIVEKLISKAEFQAGRKTLKKGHELVRLYNRLRPTGSQISPYNWQKRFMEFDRDGIPTGYFIRDINYGQFYIDKDNKEQELRVKYGLTADSDGNTIFPEEDFTKDDSVYNKYYDELDEWLDQHCERRYKLEYYKARRRHLSPKTLQAQGQVQRQIDLLLDNCRMQNGFINLSKLTVNERRQLDILRKQKRNLGSHYIFDEQNGILHVEEKTGDALKMADEISSWNKYITDKIKYKPNWQAFNDAKQQLIDQYGANSQEVLSFEKNNTTLRITPEFYDLLHDVVGIAASTPELQDLKKRHSEILNAIKERQGAGAHNLNKLGLGLNTDQSAWKELQRIEQRMADIKLDLKRRGITGSAPTNGSLTFNDVAKMLYVPVVDGQPETYLQYLINQWRQAAASNTSLVNVFNQLFTYRDERGTNRYLKAFTYLTPIDWTLNVNGNVIKCIESLPGSEYSELDESSPFVNQNFVKNGPSLQAKAFDQNGDRLYKSEAYENLDSNEKEFLQALLDTMEEANNMIPTKALNRNHMLPQISGRTMSVLSNTIQNKEWSTALKYTFRKFGVKYAETTDDVSTNVDLARRPDGTVVNNIPVRFIDPLKNRSVQTTDVLGSVIMFYNMACNYEIKSKNLPTLELIKYAVTPDQRNPNKMEDQFAKIENLLDQRYYGKETSFGFSSNEKITKQKQAVIQTTKTIRNTAAVAMLGVNFTTIEVGYIDAMLSMLCDGIAGKYLTLGDMKKAFIQCISHTGKMLKGLGNPVVNDKLVAAMQYNQLSRSNSEIFSSLDKFKLDRFVHDHLLMGGYTLTDYMVNSMMLTATYNHYKLILDPKTNKQRFYSKTMAINEFTKLGYTEKEAINLWKKSKTTLWDAYDCIEGDFVLKDKYQDIVTQDLEDDIAGRLRDRTAMYNGIIPMTEKAKIQQNVFGSFLTLMRNFYVNTYWDRFKTGGDYVTEDGDHNIHWTSEYKRDDLGLVNLETGEFEGAVFKDFCRGMYKYTANLKRFVQGNDLHKLNESQRYAVNRSISELLIIGGFLFSMLWSFAFARANNYDDDKDPAWQINLMGDDYWIKFKTDNMDDKFFDWMRWKLALLATRGFTERLTPWTPQIAVELFTSPTVVTSYLDDIGQMWGLATDLCSQRTGEEIKTGGYKHMTRGTRDLLKLFSAFGVDNIVRSWHTDGIKSTLNYYRGLKPTSAIVPSQSEWNEQHGLGSHGSEKKSKKKKKKAGEFAE